MVWRWSAITRWPTLEGFAMPILEQSATRGSQDPTLFLVEDNRADAILLKKLFFEDGFTGSLNWVSDGAQALDYLFRRDLFPEVGLPELILLDLNLPRVDGREVLKQIVFNEQTKRIPVIVLSTSNRARDIEECMDKGAASFYTKPTELAGLRQLVERLKSVEFPRLGVGRR